MTGSEGAEAQRDQPDPASPDVDASSQSPPDTDFTGRGGAAPDPFIEDRPRLYRSEEDRVLGGVAAGLADYFDADPVIVRLLWVLSVLLGGIGVVGYLVLWIVVRPYSRVYENSGGAGPSGKGAARDASTGRLAHRPRRTRSPLRTDLIFGGILIVLGSLLLIGNINIGPGWDIFGRLWPLLLIAPGAAMVAPRGGRWPSTGPLLVGGVILTVGAISLIGSLDVWSGYRAWGRLWPLLLLAGGAAFVLPRMRRGGYVETLPSASGPDDDPNLDRQNFDPG